MLDNQPESQTDEIELLLKACEKVRRLRHADLLLKPVNDLKTPPSWQQEEYEERAISGYQAIIEEINRHEGGFPS